MNLVTRGLGYEEVLEIELLVTNFIGYAVGALESDNNLVASLEEKADFVGVLQRLS